tara:strand:+ start:402 stop:782 length:381 start_codon:yes stop_codon:yes gene_type:complete
MGLDHLKHGQYYDGEELYLHTIGNQKDEAHKVKKVIVGAIDPALSDEKFHVIYLDAREIADTGVCHTSLTTCFLRSSEKNDEVVKALNVDDRITVEFAESIQYKGVYCRQIQNVAKVEPPLDELRL